MLKELDILLFPTPATSHRASSFPGRPLFAAQNHTPGTGRNFRGSSSPVLCYK